MSEARLVCAAALLLCSCTALGLSDFTVPSCSSDSDCDAANAQAGIDPATACALYACQANRCVLGPADRDRDGHVRFGCAVDDGGQGDDCDDQAADAFVGAPLLLEPALSGVAAPQWIHWSSQIDSGIATSFASSATSAFDVLRPGVALATPTPIGFAMDASLIDVTSAAIQRGCLNFISVAPTAGPPPPMGVVAGVTCETHADCSDGNFCNGYEICNPATGGDTRGCHPSAGYVCQTAEQQCDEARDLCLTLDAGVTCALAELASAHVRDDAWLTAAVVHTSVPRECELGQLRIGLTTTSSLDEAAGVPGPNVLVRGDQRRAPGFWGIDLVGSGARAACSGGGREGGVPLGVASPAVATLGQDVAGGRNRPQGLVAWLAAPRCRGTSTCGPDPLDTNGDATPDYFEGMPVGVELLGAWHEESPRGFSWVTPTSDAGPRRLPTRALGRAAPALVAITAPRAGYLLAYGAEPSGVAFRFVPAFADPPEAVTREPFGTTIVVGGPKRSTAAITDLGVEQFFGTTLGALVDSLVMAPGPIEGSSVAIVFAWLEQAEVWMAHAELDTSTGTLGVGAPQRLSTGPAGPPGIGIGCGRECEGWSIAWTESGSVRLLLLDETGARLHSMPIEIGGTSASRPQPFSNGGAVRVAYHATNAFVVTNGQCAPP